MELLYFDEQIAVCIKPVGLDSEHDLPSLLSAELGGEIFPLHRLDKNVGGVMVYARTKKAAAHFSELIRNGALVKEYVALVGGETPTEGDWVDLLWKDPSKNKVYVVKRMRGGVKEARLEFRRTSFDGKHSAVLVRLHTGRTHQIRVQFASRGYPIVGDRKYGGEPSDAPRLFSCRITFPFNGGKAVFERYPEWY